MLGKVWSENYSKRSNMRSLSLLSFVLLLLSTPSHAKLRVDYYRNICPDVESIVRSAVEKKLKQTFVTAPGTLRLFFHDCFVRGCDASVMLFSPNNTAEKDHPDDLSLAGDGFDTVIQAKAAVDSIAQCRNKVSCADILAMATSNQKIHTHLFRMERKCGGPSYAVELGRLDGKISRKQSVRRHLPHPDFNLDQLNKIFASHGLSQTDMIALSGAHTIGFSHCNQFSKRIYNFKNKNSVDPTIDRAYAAQLKQMCPRNVDPRIAITMDPMTPQKFDNLYYKNLQQGKGLFTSDQILYADRRSRHMVNLFAQNKTAFEHVFVAAITRLGRVGVKSSERAGEIRRDCTRIN